MYIAPGQGQITPWRQNFDVNRKALSLCPFVASLKKRFTQFAVHRFTQFAVHTIVSSEYVIKMAVRFVPHIACPPLFVKGQH